MGDHAEDAMCEYYADDNRDREKFWYQRDGTPIQYEQMKTTHLYNSIKMMERNKLPDELSDSVSYRRLNQVYGFRMEKIEAEKLAALEETVKLKDVKPLYDACFPSTGWVGFNNLNNKEVGRALLDFLSKFHGKL